MTGTYKVLEAISVCVHANPTIRTSASFRIALYLNSNSSHPCSESKDFSGDTMLQAEKSRPLPCIGSLSLESLFTLMAVGNSIKPDLQSYFSSG
jgi:hypothetical protein